MSRADAEEVVGQEMPHAAQPRKRYFRPLLRVGSTGLAITVTGLTYDPVQSTPAPERATAEVGSPGPPRWETSGR